MKRLVTFALAVCMVVGLLCLLSGCASSSGRYFQTTRDNKPHSFRNRIYNPGDCRYTQAGAEG